jgi:hypothetical protein
MLAGWEVRGESFIGTLPSLLSNGIHTGKMWVMWQFLVLVAKSSEGARKAGQTFHDGESGVERLGTPGKTIENSHVCPVP